MHRRHFLSAAAAALSAPAALARTSGRTRGSWHDFTPGGTPLSGRVVRGRYTVSANTFLPNDNVVYMLPLDTVIFDEGIGLSLVDQQLVVQENCLLRAYLCIDWPGQAHPPHARVDYDLRYDGIRRIPLGQALRTNPSGMTPVGEDSYDRFATIDIPASNPPQNARAQITWNPGVIPPAIGGLPGFAAIDVPLDTQGIANPGDLARAGFTSINDGMLGVGAEVALELTARVISADAVRVILRNFSSVPIPIPSGTLQVLAESATLTRGGSADAWSACESDTEIVLAGESLIAVMKSKMKGDYLQATNMTFLQVERWG